MQVWKVLHTACCKCRTQKSRQKSPSGHHPTTLLGYVFGMKACIDNRKKNLLSSNISSTCPHNMANFGPLVYKLFSVTLVNTWRKSSKLLHWITGHDEPWSTRIKSFCPAQLASSGVLFYTWPLVSWFDHALRLTDHVTSRQSWSHLLACQYLRRVCTYFWRCVYVYNFI